MTSAPDFDAARRVIGSGVSARACPAAVVEVGREAGPIWMEAFGRLTYDPDAAACTSETIFDLASLTKVVVTASVAMTQVTAGRLDLEAPVTGWVPEWTAGARAGVRVRQLLDHSSGLAAHVRLWEQAEGRERVVAALAGLPLERPPGSAAVYSDPGFMLLGIALERCGGRALDELFEGVHAAAARSGHPLAFRPAGLRDRIAPTEHDPWRKRLLIGEVHDENAAALGGVAAHAGLFGTAPAVGAFARVVLRTFREPTPLGTPGLMREFARPSSVPASSRALGWDTMRPTSSCGSRLSPTSIGHTGFTGTSLWIDWERGFYVVLLTNRVHPTRDNAALVTLRPAIHDAIAQALRS